ncbi:ROK family transcriptional regulator [Bacillus sp. AFS002410]|uniref:ROK family transcriptional regulator n=1 Tax=Bacillus sp. AFS002410 TaxID=2033481 RepID=UPI0026C01E6C
MSEIIPTPSSMKKVILRGIRSTLLKIGSATKVELSQMLEISFPTISKFLAEMEKEGEVCLVGLDDSSGGRRAKRYSYNPEHMLGLVIFLERTETNFIVFNCAGEVKEKGNAPSALLENSLDFLTATIENIMTNYPKISSMSIGVPAAVDHGKIFYIPGYEQFQNINLKEYYEEHFSIPVVVENDMNAAVLGFHNYRGIKEKQSLVYLYSGQNGPGAGIMVNGDVVRGSTFFSGEVSFVPQYDDKNFGNALRKGKRNKTLIISEDHEIDAICRLIASFVAIINPHIFIFCNDEVDNTILDKISISSTNYIPSEHLPSLTTSDWKQDYLFGLQSLCLKLMID